VSYVQENPTVLNNPALTRSAIRTLQRTGGVDAVRTAYGQAPFFNDDFAYFQQKIPGVYFFIGGSNAEKGIIAMNHAPNLQVDEESIRFGVKSFSSLIIARLGTPGEAERD
jgi:metal-dependent amidase/aminoacylase/carboxypeptidase family protein